MDSIKKFEAYFSDGYLVGMEHCRRAYEFSKSIGSDELVFKDFLWDEDIPNIVTFLKTIGMYKFLIVEEDGILHVLKSFMEEGCFIDGSIHTVNLGEDEFGEPRQLLAVEVIISNR